MAEETQQQTQQQPNGNGAALTVAEQKTAMDATPASAGLVSPFSNQSAFVAAQRMANALSQSTLVPLAYQGKVANCLIAMELASRIGVSVLAAMQNLDVIHGNPSWRAKFLIATVNASGRFTPLRPQWGGEAGKSSWSCRIVAKDKSSGEVCEGPWVTWEMANKEGWVKKNGSKWQTMPELMFFYRAAAFWTRVFCPEISIGFQTTEEVIDTYGESVATTPSLPDQLTPAGAKSLEAVLGLQSAASEVVDGTSEPPQEPAATETKSRGAKAAEKAAAAVNAGQTSLIDAKGE